VPTYQYACTACGHQLEAVQSFSDEPLTVCPACEGRLRKVFSAVGIVFKGSGFYRNDSRSDKSGSSSPAKDTTGSSAETGSTSGASTNGSSSSKTESSNSSSSSSSSGSTTGSSSASKATASSGSSSS
jgi:putative FmdB family regulatory protein